jgi:hypothetical protein
MRLRNRLDPPSVCYSLDECRVLEIKMSSYKHSPILAAAAVRYLLIDYAYGLSAPSLLSAIETSSVAALFLNRAFFSGPNTEPQALARFAFGSHLVRALGYTGPPVSSYLHFETNRRSLPWQ